MKRSLAIPGSLIAAALIAAGLSATPATAAQPTSKIISTKVTGCGSNSVTVRAPASASGTIKPSDVGPNFPAKDPLLARAARQHLQWQRTMTCRSLPAQKPVVKKSTVHPNAVTFPNWSGYESDEAATYVGMSWIVPSSGLPDDAQETYSTIWPGLGNGTSTATDELIQAGTEQRATCIELHGGCEVEGDETSFWFEVFPNESMQQITSFMPSVGDDVGVDVYYYPDDKEAVFFLCDFTSGGADGTGGCLEAVEDSINSPGPQAEWIVERPTVNGSLPPLSDYNTLNIFDASFAPTATGLYTSILNGAGYPLTMESNGDVLSTVGPLEPDDDWDSDFTATWQAYN